MMLDRHLATAPTMDRVAVFQPEHEPPATAMSDAVSSTAALTIGYLTNVYPSVSHSFIRREILALERAGVIVHRFSVRAAATALPDSGDRAEQTKTLVLLHAGIVAFLTGVLLVAIAQPARFLRAWRLALAMAHAGRGGRLRHLAYLVEACVLVRLTAARGIRHLHVHFGTNPAAVARLARALGGPTYSLTIHGPEEFDAPVELSLSQKIADAAFVVAISHFGRAQLMRWSRRADWARVSVVQCGVDDIFLRPAQPPDRGASRTFVCVARLDPQKGLSVLIEAAAQVARDEDFQLRIIGDGPMFAELARMIRHHGLEKHVVLRGWRSATEVHAEIENARALVLSSFAEGLPVVLMEALALHCPVIATAVGGVAELVDGECGWLVPAGSPGRIAAAMRAALQTPPDRLRAMGEEGRSRVLARHDAAVNAHMLLDLLSPHG